MSNTDAIIDNLKARRNAAQLARVRAETLKETAQASYDAAIASLKSEFAVDTIEDARARLSDLQRQFESQLEDITAKLDAMGC